MLKDMTLGQYYPADSLIHRLDARTKLMMTLLYIVSLFLAGGFLAYLLAAFFLTLWISLARIPLSYMLRGLRGVLFLLLISVSFNAFLTPGTVVLQIWFIRVTREGLLQAAAMACRLVLLIMGSSLLTFTTTPTGITAGLEQGLHFLTRLRLPVHEMAMMMSIALRFLPILTEETDRIMKAQMARGADFESGRLLQRVRALVPLLVPLFVSAFRRAGDLAMAMEARCYRGADGRTRMKPLHYSRADAAVYGALALYLGLMIRL